MKCCVIDLETSLGGKVFGPDARDPNNDFYTLIYGFTPDEIFVQHCPTGFKRQLPWNILTDVNILVGHNLGFDLNYIWQTPELRRYLDNGGHIWDTALAEYLMSGQRHKFPSLKELQWNYLEEQIKEDRISWCFKNGISAGRIIEAQHRCPRLWKLYNLYCKGDGSSTLRVFAAQYRRAKEMGMLPIIKAWMKGMLGLIEMENQGIHIDTVNCENTLRDFRLKSLEYLRQATHLVTPLWDTRLGTFNINSPTHKSAILFGGVFKIKEKVEAGMYKNGNPKFATQEKEIEIKGFGLPTEWTQRSKVVGRFATDEKVVRKILKISDNKTVKQYCELQKKAMTYNKMASTYLEPFITYSIEGVLQPRYNKTLTTTGRLSSSQPNMQNCCSADTEVLTRTGWKLFPELLDGEDVYQVDPTTGEGQFVTPSRVVRLYQDQPLIAINAEWGEFLYTAGHRVLSYGRRTETRYLESARDWLNFRGEIIDRKVLRSSTRLEGTVLTAKERVGLELAIIIQAEAYLDLKRKTPCYNLRFEGQRKMEQIKAFFPNIKRTSSGGVRINVGLEVAGEWLDGSKAKNFTPKVLELSHPDLVWFLKTLHKWDGDFTRECTYSQKMSKREQSLDMVQAVACLVGQSTSWYTHPSKDFSVVNFHREMFRYQSRTLVKEVPYTGMVYCVTVPTGAFLIRRNKQVVVTGNCPASGEMLVPIQGQFIAPEGWKCVDIDFNQLEPFCTALLSQDEALITDLTTGVCLHCRALSWIPSLSEGKTYEEIYQLAVVEKQEKWVLRRKKAKAINFKRAYGGGAKGLAEAENIPIEDVQAAFDGQDITYSRVKEFNDELFASIQATQQLSIRRHFSRIDQKRRKFEHGLEQLPIYLADGTTTFASGEHRHYGTYTSPFGRRITFEEVASRTRTGGVFRRYSTTETKNYQIQSLAADIVMMACAELFSYVRQFPDEVKMVRQIHDSVGFYVLESRMSLHIPKLCAIMESTRKMLRKHVNYEATFDFKVEAKSGDNFAQLEVYGGQYE